LCLADAPNLRNFSESGSFELRTTPGSRSHTRQCDRHYAAVARFSFIRNGQMVEWRVVVDSVGEEEAMMIYFLRETAGWYSTDCSCWATCLHRRFMAPI